MPTSKLTRVRSEGFSKSMAMVLPCEHRRRAIALHGEGVAQEHRQLVGREVGYRKEVATAHGRHVSDM